MLEKNVLEGGNQYILGKKKKTMHGEVESVMEMEMDKSMSFEMENKDINSNINE